MLYDGYIRIWDEAEVDEFISLHHEQYHITSHSKNSVTKFSDINTDQLADWMIASVANLKDDGSFISMKTLSFAAL